MTLRNLKEKAGDLWWYSAMIFLACRTGDVIQAFIGLWFVPKYVGPSELGAITPIQQLGSLFTIPLAALTVAFTKYVNTYAARKEYGKVKSFIRDTISSSMFVFIFCIAAAYFILPQFYSRLNIASGSLTILILASGLIGNISQLFTCALQGLKKFKAITVVNFISAPIRLVTLIIFMPFRALSGFVLGQTTPAATSSIICALSLRRELADVTIDTSWRRDIPTILRYLLPIGIYLGFSTLFGTISNTIYRQRLPEIESAAYYMLSRFADIASYVGTSMVFVLFPLAAEAHENGKENPSILKHTILATAAVTLLLSIVFALTSNRIFSLSETWSIYRPYAHLLPWITVISGAGSIIGMTISYEMACRRFKFAFVITAFSAFVTFIIASFTGYEFYRNILPDAIVNWMSVHNLSSLERLIWFHIASAAIQLAVIKFHILRKAEKHDN